MMPLNRRYGGDDLEMMIERCTRDRNLLFAEFKDKYPDARRLLPCQIVRDVLRDICGYGIEERPLPRGQFALCDFGIRRIKLNSRAKSPYEGDSLLAWQRCILAHELGHVRLHTDEVEEAVFISSNDLSQGFDDPRFFQKEYEADLYAAIFMVPRELLEKSQRAVRRREELMEAGEVSSKELWSFVDELAGVFGTTRELMRYSLEVYGWLVFRPTRRFARTGELQLVRAASWA